MASSLSPRWSCWARCHEGGGRNLFAGHRDEVRRRVRRYFGQVEIRWSYLATFTAVAIAGSLGGTYLVRYVPQGALKKTFAVFLRVMGAFILYQNGERSPSRNEARKCPTIDLRRMRRGK